MPPSRRLLIGRMAAAAAAEGDQGGDGQKHQPERGASIRGVGEFNQVGQPADQQRHAGHHGVAEGRAEGNH